MSVIEQLVEQIEARFADAAARDVRPRGHRGPQPRRRRPGARTAQLEVAAKLAERVAPRRRRRGRRARAARRGGEDAEVREMLADARARDRAPRGGDPPRDGRARPQRRQERDRRDPGGAGGDEAGLWAADLFRMLTKYAERRGFKIELLEVSDGAYTFAIKGDGAYSVFKFEGGTHRVQRVPATESQGRIHTSTATVAVLPEAEDVDVADRPERPADRRLPLVRARRAVGQHDRLGGAHHAQADRHRRLDAGREVPAAEPRAGDARAARAAVRARARRAAGRARRRPPLAGRHRRARREDPHLQLRRAPRHRPPHQAHACTTSTTCSRASSTSSRPRCRPTSASGARAPGRGDAVR